MSGSTHDSVTYVSDHKRKNKWRYWGMCSCGEGVLRAAPEPIILEASQVQILPGTGNGINFLTIVNERWMDYSETNIWFLNEMKVLAITRVIWNSFDDLLWKYLRKNFNYSYKAWERERDKRFTLSDTEPKTWRALKLQKKEKIFVKLK